MSGPKVQVIAATVVDLPVLYSLTLPARADQDHGTDMARLIELAGRTCYDSFGKGRDSAGFHRHLHEAGFLSVIEHASLSFFISNISRGCSHELVRHRIGVSISQRSTRYVDESENEWAWHPLLWCYLAGSTRTGARLEEAQLAAKALYAEVSKALQERLESLGVAASAARKQARGAARGALGNALATELVWTANLRALRHFLELRATDHADAEIRLLANRLQEAAAPYCPEWLTYETKPAQDGIGWVIDAPEP